MCVCMCVSADATTISTRLLPETHDSRTRQYNTSAAFAVVATTITTRVLQETALT